MENNKPLQYYFEYYQKCNMCDDNTTTHKIIGQRLNLSQGFKPKQKIGITTSVVQCNNCKLIYCNPQPIPNNINDHYGVPADDYWKPEYFTINEKYFSKEINQLKKITTIKPNDKALDIGAGIGHCMLALQKIGFDVYGFEPSEQFRNKAIDKMNIDASKIKLNTLENAEYTANEFDFITFGAVLEHLYKPGDAIEKAMKWLKPNGILHLEVPSTNYLVSKIINFYYRLIGTNYVTNLSPMHNPFHLYEFSIQSFQKHAFKNNYEIVFFEYDGYFSQQFPKFIRPLLNWIMKKTNSSLQITVWLKKIK